MAFDSLRQMLDRATDNGYGVPALNINNLKQIQAFREAADSSDDPAGQGRRPQRRGQSLPAPQRTGRGRDVVHQDHGISAAGCHQSIRSGFASVMMDGSLMTDGKKPLRCERKVDVSRASLSATFCRPTALCKSMRKFPTLIWS